MTIDRFNSIVDELTDSMKTTLKKKATEYNLDEDRLGNFKRAANLQGQTTAQALLGMMTKHVISIYDFVETDTKFTETMAREKICDNLNYLILLYAALDEAGFKDAESN